MAKILDLSGLACPLPVVRTKEALETEGDQGLIVVVDNIAARDNVTRFAESRGCKVEVAAAGDCYHLTIQPPAGGTPSSCIFPDAAPEPQSSVAVRAAFFGPGGATTTSGPQPGDGPAARTRR